MSLFFLILIYIYNSRNGTAAVPSGFVRGCHTGRNNILFGAPTLAAAQKAPHLAMGAVRSTTHLAGQMGSRRSSTQVAVCPRRWRWGRCTSRGGLRSRRRRRKKRRRSKRRTVCRLVCTIRRCVRARVRRLRLLEGRPAQERPSRLLD